MATWQQFTDEAQELTEKVLARFRADQRIGSRSKETRMIPVRDRDRSAHLAHRHPGFSRGEAAEILRSSARAPLRAALAV
jgi:hypothetical protein